MLIKCRRLYFRAGNRDSGEGEGGEGSQPEGKCSKGSLLKDLFWEQGDTRGRG